MARSDINYDESKVPDYALPDPLIRTDGIPVSDARTWREQRRPEILELFERQMYGRAPGRPEEMSFATTSLDREALGGAATRREVSVSFTDRDGDPTVGILLYLPNESPGPVPSFVGLNF